MPCFKTHKPFPTSFPLLSYSDVRRSHFTSLHLFLSIKKRTFVRRPLELIQLSDYFIPFINISWSVFPAGSRHTPCNILAPSLGLWPCWSLWEHVGHWDGNWSRNLRLKQRGAELWFYISACFSQVIIIFLISKFEKTRQWEEKCWKKVYTFVNYFIKT